MNILENIRGREKGSHFTKQYDLAIRRLKCFTVHEFSADSPAFVCKFCKVENYQEMLALANEEGKIALQTVCHGGNQRSLIGIQAHHNAIFDLEWMENEFKMVSVSGDHTAILWEVGQGDLKEVCKFQSHTRSLKTVAFRPQDPAVFVTGARDGVIMVWDTRCNKDQLKLMMTPDNHIMNAHQFPGSKHTRNKFAPTSRASSITSLVFQDENSLISSGAGDGLIKVWDLRKNYWVYKKDPAPRHVLKYHGSMARNGFTNLVLDPSRTRLYASCLDNMIYCYNVATYDSNPVGRYSGHQNSNFYIKSCLSPDGQYLVSGSNDERAYIWNVNRPEKPIVSLFGHNGEVTSVAWCPVGETRIVMCSDDAHHSIWEVGYDVLDEYDAPRECWGWAESDDPTTSVRKSILPRPHKRAIPIIDETPKSTRKWMLGEEHTPDRSPNFVTMPLSCKCINSPCDHCQVGRNRPSHHGRLLQESTTKRKLEMEDNPSPQTKHSKAENDTRPNNTGVKRILGVLQPQDDNTSCSDSSRDNLPPKKRICLSSPTMNLPNYVMDGTTPYHCCKRTTHMKENVDWLTKLRKEKEHRENQKSTKSRPRHSRETGHSDSLLRYFTVNKQ